MSILNICSMCAGAFQAFFLKKIMRIRMTFLVFFEVCLFIDKYLRINFQIFVLVVPAVLTKWVELMVSKAQRNNL